MINMAFTAQFAASLTERTDKHWCLGEETARCNLNWQSRNGMIDSKFGQQVERIWGVGGEASYDCEGLTSITMCGERPDAPGNVFKGSRNLKSIHVPANAKSWAGVKEWQGVPFVFDGQ